MRAKRVVSAILFAITLMQGILISASNSNEEEWMKPTYDGRNIGVVTPVQDQGDSDLCWAYSAIGAAETSLLKSNLAEKTIPNSTILSPTQLGYACQNRGSDPLGNTNEIKNDGDFRYSKGSSYYAASLFSQWCGPVKYGLLYNCNGWENAKYCLTGALNINPSDLKNSEESRLELKKAIVKYGAVTFSYNNAREEYYYNPSNETGTAAYSHACVIVGWDDNIPSSDFMPGGATQNGGWLIKNSYNSLPFFYLSYDNTSSNTYAFSFVSREDYDNNYFYDSDTADFGLGSLLKPKNAANIFEAKGGTETKKESIAAVNVGIDGNDAKISVKVYTNLKNTSDPTSGDLAATGCLETKYPGYHTIELSNAVETEKGSYFSVVAEITNSANAYFKLTQNSGRSFMNRGSGWNEAVGVPRIKAYTKTVDKEIEISDSYVALNTAENKKGFLILAYYEDILLKGTQVISIDNSINKKFDIPGEWEKGDGCRLKAFFWESFGTIVPICFDETSWE